MIKILILLTYYERPNLVKNALRSIANSSYDNWEVAFIDDGVIHPGKPIVEKILPSSKVKFFASEMDSNAKITSGGCFIGKYMNDAIKDSDADVAIMLSDDDELVPNYLENLNIFFSENNVLSCYSNVYIYNPLKEKSVDVKTLSNSDPNWKGHVWFGQTTNCAYKVDGSQVAWKLACNKVHGAWFDYPITMNHDALFFTSLYERCGPSVYTGFISQYKAVFEDQLIKRVMRGDNKVLDKVEQCIV